MNTQFIPMANKSCTSCGYLVSTATKYFEQCHYTKGNTQCPAQHFKIGVGVNIEKASTAIAEALYAKDVEALAKHINRLATFDRDQTEQVLDLVFDKTAVLYGNTVEEFEEQEAATEQPLGVPAITHKSDEDMGYTSGASAPMTGILEAASYPSISNSHQIVLDDSDVFAVAAPEVAKSSTMTSAAPAPTIVPMVEMDSGDEWSDEGQPTGA